MRKAGSLSRPCLDRPRLELVLRLDDGTPWRLELSPGMERFIGLYPRVDGIGGGAPLLRFEVADIA